MRVLKNYNRKRFYSLLKKRIKLAFVLVVAIAATVTVTAVSPVSIQAEELMTAVEFAVYLDDGELPVGAEVTDGDGQVEGMGVAVGADQAEGAEVIDGTEAPEADDQSEDGKSPLVTLGAYTNNRDNMMYLSVRDLAKLVNGTPAQFQFALDQETWSYEITKGAAYVAPEVDPGPRPESLDGLHEDADGNLLNENDEIVWMAKPDLPERPEYEYLDLVINPLNVDGSEVKYYSYQLSLDQDLYMNPTDIQLMLGITLTKEPDGAIRIRTDRGFDIDISAYEEDGYFDFFNGALVGDATTGEILYSYKGDNVDAIASTSKLMTYLLAARYLENGRIHMDDKVVISDDVGALIDFGYGNLPLYVGQEVTFKDLLAAMMLCSSNEAAMAIAEHVAGSEEEFVRLMNETAGLLGLTTAKFCNANGLPKYSDSLIASVQENQMSAADLFRLSKAILDQYPAVTELTTLRKMYCPSIDLEVENSNRLLCNMPNCVGLKTGTTDEAGCCMVAASRVTKDDGEHTLVAIVLGANDNIQRFQVPQLLLTWAEKQ